MVPRYRWLLHKAVEDNFSGFFTFSVGCESFEHVVVCRNEAILCRIQSKECTHEKALIWASNKFGTAAVRLLPAVPQSEPPHKIARMKTVQDGKQVLQPTMNSQAKGTSRRPDIQLYVPRARRSVNNPTDSSNTRHQSTSSSSQDKKIKPTLKPILKEKTNCLNPDLTCASVPCELSKIQKVPETNDINQTTIINSTSISEDITFECSNFDLINICNSEDSCNNALQVGNQFDSHHSNIVLPDIIENIFQSSILDTDSRSVNGSENLCKTADQSELDQSVDSSIQADSTVTSVCEENLVCLSTSSPPVDDAILIESSPSIFGLTSDYASPLESHNKSNEKVQVPLCVEALENNSSRRVSDTTTRTSPVETEENQNRANTVPEDARPQSQKNYSQPKVMMKGSAQRKQSNEGDSWDSLFDENGDSLHPSVKEGLSAALGKNIEIHKPKIDYLSFQPLEPDLSDETYDHILELYDFPAEFKTPNLLMAFSAFKDRGFDIKWVDDTHALAIFSSPVAAAQALEIQIPFIKVRPVSQAISKSKSIVSKQLDFLLPARPRPETSASLARRMITGALGMRSQISKEQRESERRRLQDAKEKKKQVAKQKQDIWNGTVS